MPLISFASSSNSWATWSQASWGPAPGVWVFFHFEDRFPDGAFYWFDILIKSTQIRNSKWRKITPATTTERMWNLQPGNCWIGLCSRLFCLPSSPQPQGNMWFTHTHAACSVGKFTVFLWEWPSITVQCSCSREDSFKRFQKLLAHICGCLSLHPLLAPSEQECSAAVPSALGGHKGKLVALHTSHLHTHFCWLPYPNASSSVNVVSCMHISIPSLLNKAGICFLL